MKNMFVSNHLRKKEGFLECSTFKQNSLHNQHFKQKVLNFFYCRTDRKENMCKFNNRLFIFAICGLLMGCTFAKPRTTKVGSSSSSSLNKNKKNNALNDLLALSVLFKPDNNYDLHYDQRQKGDKNFRVKVDGVFIGLPDELVSGDFNGALEDLFDYPNDSDESFTPWELLYQNDDDAAITTTENLNYSSQDNKQNDEGLVVEIPSSKKDSESRATHVFHLGQTKTKSGTKSKSFITRFFKFLKPIRKTSN